MYNIHQIYLKYFIYFNIDGYFFLFITFLHLLIH